MRYWDDIDLENSAPTGIAPITEISLARRGVLGAVWAWLLAWVSVSGPAPLGGPCPRPAYHPGVNRRSRRLYRRTLPAARNGWGFYHLVRKDLTPTQYTEALCRLSVHGRTRLYLLGRNRRRSVRKVIGEAVQRAHAAGMRGRMFCAAPLSPD